jgi:hypothetical protein
MRGTIPPLSQYVFMVWCLVKHRDNLCVPSLINFRKHSTKQNYEHKIINIQADECVPLHSCFFVTFIRSNFTFVFTLYS